MKKNILLILTVLLSAMSLMAQSPCFNAAFTEGQRLYRQGNYTQAKKYFKEAKECPDPNIADANEWIKKCDWALAEAEKKKLEAEAAKTAYMNIRRIDYCNVERNGQMIDDYGAKFYPSKMKCLQPRITYDAILDETRDPILYIKVINPSNYLVTGKNSPSGYTYSATVRVAPGKEKTVLLPTWDNNGLTYSTGNYKFEIWYNDKLIYSSSFSVVEDPKVPEPPAPPVLVDKKAEIKVMDKYGLPLEGAKLSIIGTGKYELTNSEGIGRIDLSDKDTKRIEVSHTAYQDKREIWVHIGDQQKVALYQPVSQSKPRIGVVDYIVPGLAQMKTGKTAEGVVFLGGEALLLAGGFVSNSMASNQLKIMQNENVSLADYKDAHSKYKVLRIVNIASFSTAALVYATHLYRTYTISSKYGSSLSMAPAVICIGDEMAFGMNINLSF